MGKVVDAEVPLAEMFGYATDLRSATQGRATFTMEFEKYTEAPKNITEAVMAKNMGSRLVWQFALCNKKPRWFAPAGFFCS